MHPKVFYRHHKYAVAEVVVVFVVAVDFLAGAFTSFEQPVIKAKQAMQNKLCKIIFFIALI